jgi:general secretion pathway protein G
MNIFEGEMKPATATLKPALARTLQRGFTLIEVMVVVAIIGILATIVMTNVVGKDEQARIKTTQASLLSVANALELYKLDNHKYPTTDEGLEALVHKPASVKTFPDGGYLRKLPEDPWGNAFQYIAPGSEGKPFDLYSFGADGTEGGEGNNADIYYK